MRGDTRNLLKEGLIVFLPKQQTNYKYTPDGTYTFIPYFYRDII